MNAPIRRKDRDTLLQALRAGVVPCTGQHLIQVGRIQEVSALIGDLERLADGGAAFRLVIGDYGAGKTFFLNLVRSIAMEKKIVVAHADLNPDRRLQATGGQARSLLAELMKNLSTRSKPEGGALAGIVEKFIMESTGEAQEKGESLDKCIGEKLSELTEMVNGYDFAHVILAYRRGFSSGDEALKRDAIRWLRGEFTSKQEAKQSLGVRTIVDDEMVYDHLKLMAKFVRAAGYGGLLVSLDEMVNIYKLSAAQARKGNYEQILRILNDTLQGFSVGLGFVMAGTTEFLKDNKRGLYSYEALQGRLATNSYAVKGLVDMSGPVISLLPLSTEELFVLLQKIRHVYANGDSSRHLVDDAGIQAYMQSCSKRLGEASFRTPRTVIKSFVDLLSVLEQNPGVSLYDLIGHLEVIPDQGALDEKKLDADEDLSSFRM